MLCDKDTTIRFYVNVMYIDNENMSPSTYVFIYNMVLYNITYHRMCSACTCKL